MYLARQLNSSGLYLSTTAIEIRAASKMQQSRIDASPTPKINIALVPERFVFKTGG